MLIVGTVISTSYDFELKESEGNLTKAVITETISESSGKKLELLGQYDENIGKPSSMYIEGDFLYTTSASAGLVKINISDPIEPKIVGINRNESERYSSGFCIKNNIGYFPCFNYIRVVNVTDINNVVELDRIPEIYYRTKAKAYGNLLIVNNDHNYIKIFDITDPVNMILLNTLDFTHLDFAAVNFDYEDDNLYLAGLNDNNSTLVIYNLADINNPVYLGNYTAQYKSLGMKVIVEDSIAYIMNEYDLQVISLLNLTAPSLIKTITFSLENSVELDDMILADETIYIIKDLELFVYDVSNSANIFVIDKKIEFQNLQELAIQENYLYITSPYTFEIIIYDTSTPSSLIRASTFSFGGYSYDVCVEKKIAYVANSGGGIQILDVSEAKKPKIIGSYYDGDIITLVKKSGAILFSITQYKCMKMIDVSNPRSPILLGQYQFEMLHNIFDFKISENRVFLIDPHEGLEIIDVSDKSNPKLLGSQYQKRYMSCLDVKNDFVITNYPEGFQILDVSNPSDIQIISKSEIGGGTIVDKIFIEGNRIYLFSFDHEYSGYIIYVVNIDNIKKPKLISLTYFDFTISDIKVNGDYLYLLATGKLIVLRNNFGRLSYVGQSTETEINEVNLAIDKGFVYIASGYDGLKIFKAFSSMKITTIIIISSAFTAVLIISVIIFLILRKKR